MKKYKLAILISHPIQYQVSLFKMLAEHPQIDLTVYFCCKYGVEKTFDSAFKEEIEWKIPLLEGYKHKFLKNWCPCPSPVFWKQINPGILKELKRNKFDALLIHGWAPLNNWLVLLSKIPLFLRAENPLNQELLKPKWKIEIKKRILGSFFKRISAFLFIGEENKKLYQFYGVEKEKLFFTPYAVDNERFITEAKKYKDKKEKLKEELGISPGKTVILFVGKLIEKKRPLDLIDAYEKIASNNKALVFIGNGEQKDKIVKRIKEKNLEDVYLAGFKDQADMPRYYALADIFVLPSGLGETWGVVVNEAMCAGLPIIISDVVGCGSDLALDGENGYIFPLGDTDQLKNFLEELIRDPDKRKRFGGKSLNIIRAHSYKQDVEGILKALQSITEP